MQPYTSAFFMGVIAGLRSLTAPALVSWAARGGSLKLKKTNFRFMGFRTTADILTVLAVLELIADKLPSTPSRKIPPVFAARLVMGALSGAAIGASGRCLLGGLLSGVGGSIAGTYAGYEFRSRLVKATGGHDLPVALLEDLIAIGGGTLVVKP